MVPTERRHGKAKVMEKQMTWKSKLRIGGLSKRCKAWDIHKIKMT